MKLITQQMLKTATLRNKIADLITKRVSQLIFKSDNDMSVDHEARVGGIDFLTVPNILKITELDDETVEVEGRIKAEIELQTHIHTSDNPEMVSETDTHICTFRFQITVDPALRSKAEAAYISSFQFDLMDLSVT
jgi:hypothetical protein